METTKIDRENPEDCNTNSNYKYWREVQRTQLGISANLYFIFCSAIFRFILKTMQFKISSFPTITIDLLLNSAALQKLSARLRISRGSVRIQFTGVLIQSAPARK